LKNDSVGIPYKRAETDKDDVAMSSNYERSNNRSFTQLYTDVMYHKITSMCLNPNEEQIIFGTNNNQLISLKINLEKPSDEAMPYDYLITSFHSKHVSSLDTCIQKQLVATCSVDRTVRLWNY